MKLTNKCKVDFEKWYFKNHCKSNMKFKELLPHHKQDVFGWFYNIDLSFQYGVYVDFFDSVDVEVSTFIYTVRINGKKDFSYQIMDSTHVAKEIGFERFLTTRQEARTEAIKQANKIYNLNFKN